MKLPLLKQIKYGFGVPGGPLGQFAQLQFVIGVFGPSTPAVVCDVRLQNFAPDVLKVAPGFDGL